VARGRLLFGVLAFGYAFLYVPILSVIVYAFNESRLVTVWAGFSLRWWSEVFDNTALLDAAWLSLRIALVNATGATILGTIAAFAIVRRSRFAGRTLFTALLAAPMVMPEVVMGIAMLLLFVGLEYLTGWPERGFTTITIAHITFSMAFFVITLPLILPAVVAGWLLAFTLSLDDLILTQFVAGPASQTLPMQIYSSIRLGVSPQINVIATIVVLVVVSCVLAAGLLMMRAHRTRGGQA
jgi:putrescine transport system permease protein